MTNLGIDELMNSTKSIYKLAVLAARRAQELSQGSSKLIEAGPNAKYTTIALKEIVEKKISYKEASSGK